MSVPLVAKTVWYSGELKQIDRTAHDLVEVVNERKHRPTDDATMIFTDRVGRKNRPEW